MREHLADEQTLIMRQLVPPGRSFPSGRCGGGIGFKAGKSHRGALKNRRYKTRSHGSAMRMACKLPSRKT